MLEKKIRRYKLMDEHRRLVREGKFREANTVSGTIPLWSNS